MSCFASAAPLSRTLSHYKVQHKKRYHAPEPRALEQATAATDKPQQHHTATRGRSLSLGSFATQTHHAGFYNQSKPQLSGGTDAGAGGGAPPPACYPGSFSSSFIPKKATAPKNLAPLAGRQDPGRANFLADAMLKNRGDANGTSGTKLPPISSGGNGVYAQEQLQQQPVVGHTAQGHLQHGHGDGGARGLVAGGGASSTAFRTSSHQQQQQQGQDGSELNPDGIFKAFSPVKKRNAPSLPHHRVLDRKFQKHQMSATSQAFFSGGGVGGASGAASTSKPDDVGSGGGAAANSAMLTNRVCGSGSALGAAAVSTVYLGPDHYAPLHPGHPSHGAAGAASSRPLAGGRRELGEMQTALPAGTHSVQNKNGPALWKNEAIRSVSLVEPSQLPAGSQPSRGFEQKNSSVDRDHGDHPEPSPDRAEEQSLDLHQSVDGAEDFLDAGASSRLDSIVGNEFSTMSRTTPNDSSQVHPAPHPYHPHLNGKSYVVHEDEARNQVDVKPLYSSPEDQDLGQREVVGEQEVVAGEVVAQPQHQHVEAMIENDDDDEHDIKGACSPGSFDHEKKVVLLKLNSQQYHHRAALHSSTRQTRERARSNQSDIFEQLQRQKEMKSEEILMAAPGFGFGGGGVVSFPGGRSRGQSLPSDIEKMPVGASAVGVTVATLPPVPFPSGGGGGGSSATSTGCNLPPVASTRAQQAQARAQQQQTYPMSSVHEDETEPEPHYDFSLDRSLYGGVSVFSEEKSFFPNKSSRADRRGELTDASSYEQIPLSSASEELEAFWMKNQHSVCSSSNTSSMKEASASAAAVANRSRGSSHVEQEQPGEGAVEGSCTPGIMNMNSTAPQVPLEGRGPLGGGSSIHSAEVSAGASSNGADGATPSTTTVVVDPNPHAHAAVSAESRSTTAIVVAEAPPPTIPPVPREERHGYNGDAGEPPDLPPISPRLRVHVERSLHSLVSTSRRKIPNKNYELQAHCCGITSVDAIPPLLPLLLRDRRFEAAAHIVWAFRAGDQLCGKSCFLGAKVLELLQKSPTYDHVILLVTVKRGGLYPTLYGSSGGLGPAGGGGELPQTMIPLVLAQVRELLEGIVGKEDIILQRRALTHPATVAASGATSAATGADRSTSSKSRNSSSARGSTNKPSASQQQQPLGVDLSQLPELPKPVKRRKYSKNHFKYNLQLHSTTGAAADTSAGGHQGGDPLHAGSSSELDHHGGGHFYDYDPDAFLEALFAKPDMEQMVVNEEVLQHFTKEDLEALQALRQPHALVEKVVVLIGCLKNCQVLKPDILRRVLTVTDPSGGDPATSSAGAGGGFGAAVTSAGAVVTSGASAPVYQSSGSKALDILATRGGTTKTATSATSIVAETSRTPRRNSGASNIAAQSGVAWATLKDLVLTKTLRMELVFLHLGLVSDRNIELAARLAGELSVAEVRRIQPGAAMLLEYAQALLFDDAPEQPKMRHALLDVGTGIQTISIEETYALKELNRRKRSSSSGSGGFGGAHSNKGRTR